MMEFSDNPQNIYIKRGPEIFDATRAKELAKQMEEELGENPALGSDPFLSSIASLMKESSKKGGTVDSSGCETFWTIKEQRGERITLIEQHPITPLEMEFDSLAKMEEKFIDLDEFLGEAKYVGRYFKRTAPAEGDIGYMKEDNSTLVLFVTDYNMLVYERVLGEWKYKMLSPRYFDDGNYEYYGEQNKEYDDPEAVHQAISKQISKSKTNTM